MSIDADRPNEGSNTMTAKSVIATIARGVALAGFLLSLIGNRVAVLGGEPSAVKGVSLRGLDNGRIKLAPPAGGATVLVFYSSECPISNAYSPTLQELMGKYRQKPVDWVGICVDPDLSDSEVKTHSRDFKLDFRIARDPLGSFARKIGATVTPEAFVLDDKGQVRYHGRIDDQFVARRVRNASPSGSELRDAIASVLNGKEVAIAHVAAVGCPIPEAPAAVAAPTYTKDVASILQQNCQECHRRGQVGPFSLETYEQARKRAADIATVAEDRAMPPWKASPHVGVKFKDTRVLSDKDIATIVAWSKAGAPEGNPRDLPPPPKFADDWQLGTPDLIVDTGTDFQVPATGGDIYRCFVVPTKLDKDEYVTAIEYRPGNRRVVHHLLTYVDVSGEARKRDQADPGPGYSCFSGPGEPIHGDLGGWAPGIQPSGLPEGIGRSLPRGGDIIVQVHYHPNGKAETDRTRIGLHFARKPIRQTLHWAAAADLGMELPAGNANVEIKAAWPIPVDLVAHAVTPHMHLLGHDISMSIKFPDGHEQDLIKIDDWDFNWQYSYFFEKPLELPKGSVLNVVAHYNNSDSNPRNPNKPPKLVKWGEATTDEMCVGFIAVTKKGQDLTRPGEKDDLMDIFRKQMEEYRERREKEMREARSKSGK
jgi:mono/diheme cytochrome c family protein/thiol-disulfide isomerase/thioredoxin